MHPIDLFVLIPFCIFAETASALCFKRGVSQDEVDSAGTGILRMLRMNRFFWLGIALWAAELVAWIVVLEHTPLSVAFPLMSLIYCTVPLAGKWVLNEPLPARHWLATLLITAGVALVGSTGL